MPISYGNVAGRKWNNVQPEYVPVEKEGNAVPLDGDAMHGSEKAYRVFGCRCWVCVSAERKRQRDGRLEAPDSDVSDSDR